MLPIDSMELFEKQNQQIGISPLEDPLQQLGIPQMGDPLLEQFSLFGKQAAILKPLDPVLPEIFQPDILQPFAEPSFIQESLPVIIPGGPRSPDPPLPEENTWRGLPQYDPHGFGRVRSSRSGIRNPSDVYCELRGERIESSECNNICEYYDENQVCRYGEDSQSNGEEGASE